jgi:hypothetical protein
MDQSCCLREASLSEGCYSFTNELTYLEESANKTEVDEFKLPTLKNKTAPCLRQTAISMLFASQAT